MTAMTIAERNLAAEARAVEEGHRAFVQPGGWVKVVSDSYEGKSYKVTFVAMGSGLVFRCKPEEGRKLFTDDHRQIASQCGGHLPCKHAAVAARRLEREGLAEIRDGRWFPTEAAMPAPIDPDDDPFKGL